MEPTSDEAIRNYVRTQGKAYTREAVREHLVAAGHDPARIDAIWAEEWGAAASPKASTDAKAVDRIGITAYVILWLIIGLLPLLGNPATALPFIAAWLVAGGIAGFLITRVRVSGWGWLLAIPLVPVALFLVWWGTCLATYNVLRTGGNL